MGWNMSKHVETTNGRKWLEKLTFRLVKHVCAWNLPCYLLGHLTPLMWNPLGKRLFCSFLINHLSRSMVLAVQRTFLSNPKPSHVFASRGFPKDWTLNHINFNPIPQKPSQPPQKKTPHPKNLPKKSPPSHLAISFLSFFPRPRSAWPSPWRVSAWKVAARCTRPGVMRRRPRGERRRWSGASMRPAAVPGVTWDEVWVFVGEPPGSHADFRLESDFEQRHQRLWECAVMRLGQSILFIGKTIKHNMFFQCCLHIALLLWHPTHYTKHTPKMEVHDGLRHWVCFFVCFLWVFDSLGLIQTNPNQIWFILPPKAFLSSHY